MTVKTAEQKNSEYDNLMEERTAFEQAGMDAKVAEWDHKIAVVEVGQKYEKIDFQHIADQFGIQGLNEALAGRKRRTEDEAKKIIGDQMLKAKVISETKMYDFIDRNAFRYADKPEIGEEILKLLSPKLKGTAQKIFSTMFKIKNIENAGEKKIAFIKIEKVENYIQNDNPPMEELIKVVQAKTANLFHCLYIAFPMIGYEKHIDPIIFGTLQNPNAQYNELSPNLNNELSIDMLDWLNLGDMFKIAEWI